MKAKIIVILAGVAVLHLLLLAGICSTGGCKTHVLERRTFIPAPTPKPITEEIEVEPTQEEEIKIEKTSVEPGLPPFPPVEITEVSYTVKKGDSFWKIARMYGVSSKELAAHNNMSLKKPLVAGKVLKIPPGGKFVPAEKRPPVKKIMSSEKKKRRRKPESASSNVKKQIPLPAKNTGAGSVYTVKKGDSLWKIAVRHNLKVSTLAAANSLDSRKSLVVGQKLYIPSKNAKGLQDIPVPPKKIKAVAEKKADEETAKNTVAALTSSEAAPTPQEKNALDLLDRGDYSGNLVNIPDPDSSKQSVKSIIGNIEPDSTVEIVKDTTVDRIAKDYQVTPEEIRKWNPNIPADGKLKKGEVINIKWAP